MKATLVSFIDSSNIGDRLIAETLSEQLLTGIEIKKYSYKLNLVRRSKPHDIYYKYFRQLPLIKNVVSKGKWIRSRRRMYNSEDIQRFEAALQQSDFLMIGGGNAIFDLSPATLSAQRFDQVVSLAKQHQLPIFVSSIGIGPFCTKKQQNAAIATLKKCDFVSFRDKRSLEYLKNAGHPAAYASVDPVFLLPEVETFEQLKAQKKLQQRIGICVIDYRITGCSRKDYLNYLKDMKNLIHDLATAKKEIILFSSEVQDYETIETLYADFLKEPQVNVVFVKEKEDLLALYQSLNLVIGTRMHSMIVAVSQFVPIIGLSWQQKVVEMFKNLGIEEDVLAIADLSKKREILSKKIDEKLENTDQELIEMRRHKEEMRRAFAINYEIIDTLQQHLVDV